MKQFLVLGRRRGKTSGLISAAFMYSFTYPGTTVVFVVPRRILRDYTLRRFEKRVVSYKYPAVVSVHRGVINADNGSQIFVVTPDELSRGFGVVDAVYVDGDPDTGSVDNMIEIVRLVSEAKEALWMDDRPTKSMLYTASRCDTKDLILDIVWQSNM